MTDESPVQLSETSRIPLKNFFLQFAENKVSREKRPVLLKEYFFKKFEKIFAATVEEVMYALGTIIAFTLSVLLWIPEPRESDVFALLHTHPTTAIAVNYTQYGSIGLCLIGIVFLGLLLWIGLRKGNPVGIEEVELLTAAIIKKLPAEVILVRASNMSTFDGERVLLRVADEAPQEQLLRPIHLSNTDD